MSRAAEQAELKARLRVLQADDPLHDEVFARLVLLDSLQRAEDKAAAAELSPWQLLERIELARALILHHFGMDGRGAREVLAALNGATGEQISRPEVTRLAERRVPHG